MHRGKQLQVAVAGHKAGAVGQQGERASAVCIRLGHGQIRASCSTSLFAGGALTSLIKLDLSSTEPEYHMHLVVVKVPIGLPHWGNRRQPRHPNDEVNRVEGQGP